MLTQTQFVELHKAISLAAAQAMMPFLKPDTQQPKAAKVVQFKSKSQPKAVKAAPVTDRKAAFAAQVVATFKAKGLKVTPMVDVLTFGKWEAKGFRPKAGEQATFVKTKDMNGNGIALFHKEQVERVAA